jgi:NPCBM/NEW2 domain
LYHYVFSPGHAALALDELVPIYIEVGYGDLGRRGWLGYEGTRVTVGGQTYISALSTRPPARLRFAVLDACARLRCRVALNDDVAGRNSYATFAVLAGRKVIAEAPNVRAAAAAVPLVADLASTSVLELVVSTTAWAYCHAVCIQPVFDTPSAAGHSAGTVSAVSDPLLRADIWMYVAGLCHVLSPGLAFYRSLAAASHTPPTRAQR